MKSKITRICPLLFSFLAVIIVFTVTIACRGSFAEAGIEISYLEKLCEIYDLEFVDRNYGWAACLYDLADTDQFGVLRTSDAGETWVFIPFDVEGYMLRDIRFVSREIGYGIAISDIVEDNKYYSAEIYPIPGLLVKTLDGGSSWNVMENADPGNVLYSSFIDEKRGWIVGCVDGDADSPLIRGTTNGGSDWTLLFAPQSAINDFRVIDENTLVFGTGYFFGTSGRAPLSFWLSTDGGISWNKEQGDEKDGLILTEWHATNRIIPTPEGSAFCLLSRDYTQRFPSTELWYYDLNKAYERENGYTGDVLPCDETSAIILNTDIEGIQAWLTSTGNRGEDFTFLTDLPAFVYDDFELHITVKKLVFSDANTVWISGWMDKLVKYTLEGMSVEESFPRPSFLTLHAPFPNPFNPATTIRFELTERSDAELVVYDVTGQKVATIIDNTVLNSGTYNIVFDGSGLASGVYMYVCRAGTTSESGTMVMIK